jgi:hypothetical protein
VRCGELGRVAGTDILHGMWRSMRDEEDVAGLDSSSEIRSSPTASQRSSILCLVRLT